jgi:putative SOS response-associated peptidase YedK
MCYTTSIQKDTENLEKRFKRIADAEAKQFQKIQYEIGFTFPKTPVISNDKPEVISLLGWGLLPFWAKDTSFRKNLLNAKIETIKELPSFRNSVKNRCLVLVDGFYEWEWLDAKGKQKQKYHIILPSHEAFAMAGIWSEWVDKATGEVLKTYTIVTTEADEFMAKIHNTKKRMPVILTPDNEELWLNGADVDTFKKPIVELVAEKEA